MSFSHLSVSERVRSRLGTVVQQKYRIERILGVGGTAAVYAATHRNGHRVAIKFLLEHLFDDPYICHLFWREGYVANEVGHAGAVPVLDDDVDENGCAFLVMPLLEGETVRARWERAEGRRLPLAEVGWFLSEVLDVLVSAHAHGIVHRDIKPDNLFITSEGRVRVLDFGIARRSGPSGTVTLTGGMVGTPAFMPPEQALGDRNAIGPRSDLWAVGATMFSLLSGEFVHISDNASAQLVAAATRPARSLGEVAPHLPLPIAAFVDRSLAFRPEDRWPSAAEMRDALRDALGAPFPALAAHARDALVEELSARRPEPQAALSPTLESRDDRVSDGSVSALHAQMTSLVNASLGIPTHLVPSDDGRFVFFLRAHPRDARQSLWETDLATGETRELLRPDALGAEPENLSPEELTRRERQRISASGFTSFQVAHDTIIVPLSGRLYALTRASGKVRELATGAGAAVDPQLSPDGTEVAYVRDYDVHVLALEEGAHERAVTQGGTEMRSNGLAEHIAQEELFRSRGFWWSPDGRHILYEEADLSPVQRLSIADPTHPERAPTLRAYPRAGTPNAIVRLAMAKVPSHAAEPPRRVTWDIARYPYLAAVAWTANAPPTIYVLDRVQQTGVLLTIDPATGETHTLHTEHDAIWLNVDPSVPRWLPDGSGFLWSTERHGAWELELRDPGGDLRETIVPAHLGYRELLALDANCVYVSACSDPTRSEVWAAALDGSARQPVARLEGGVVSARFNGAGDVYAFSEGTKLGERRFGARATDDSWQVQIASLADPLPFTPKVEYTTVGEEAFHVAIIRPRHFDPARRYPLIDAVYGGPHHNMVTADAVTYLRHQWIADVADAIVVAIDAHGTMWRGRDWERKLRDRIGDVPLEGHVAAIRALAKRYSEIDATRVGIYGWSFGGYLSSLAILRRPDVFKVGAAGAPVVDQADYDTCYTERYLGIPPNPAFERASLLTWAARPPSASSPARPFFLTHGTIDDNVLFANSLKLVNTMVKAGRPVEFVPLVGVTHMLTSPEIASPVWTRIALFLRDHL